MSGLRALWFVRDDLERHRGGDTTQILRTKAAMEERGAFIELRSPGDLRFDGFDIVHLWHMDRLWETLPICRRLREQSGPPSVLSTIYWPTDEFDVHGRGTLSRVIARTIGTERLQAVRNVVRAARTARGRDTLARVGPLLRFRAGVQYVLDTVRAILPNSKAERERIAERFTLRCASVCVPNAVDTRVFHPGGANAAERSGVVCVGRIEPRKNQLALVRAVRGLPVRLGIVGDCGARHRAYFDQIRREAGDNVSFTPAMGHEQLVALYRQSLVHVNVSWYETPGLASLEAGVCGCRLVVTPGGCTREYFGDHALYADPSSPASIRAAILAATSGGAPEPDPESWMTTFTWNEAAIATGRAYEIALQRS